MRFDPSSQATRVVQWYEVPSTRPVLPFNHAFGSWSFVDDELLSEELGEQAEPRVWRDCGAACRVPTSGLCGSAWEWEHGTIAIADDGCCGPPGPGDCGGLAIGRAGFGACHMEATCDIYSPFGAASPSAVNVPCQLVEDLLNGRGTSPNNTVAWTHYIDVAEPVAIFDGCTRTATLNTIDYLDGDEVRIPTGGSTRYVVVWVTLCDTEGTIVKRAFLMRHAV